MKKNIINEAVKLLEDSNYEVTINPSKYIGNEMVYCGYNLLVQTGENVDEKYYSIEFSTEFGVRGCVHGIFKDYDPENQTVTFYVNKYGPKNEPREFKYVINDIKTTNQVWKPGWFCPRSMEG